MAVGHGRSVSLVTHAKILLLELPKVKADLERELEDFVLNCSKCGLDVHWVSRSRHSRRATGPIRSPRRTASRRSERLFRGSLSPSLRRSRDPGLAGSRDVRSSCHHADVACATRAVASSNRSDQELEPPPSSGQLEPSHSSEPDPPCSWSVPEPPSSESVPSPPYRRSSPVPPESVSCPPPPQIVSLPPRPSITSLPPRPTMTSCPEVP